MSLNPENAGPPLTVNFPDTAHKVFLIRTTFPFRRNLAKVNDEVFLFFEI